MASDQTIGRRRKPATPRPTRPSRARTRRPAPPPDVAAPDIQLTRNIELVILNYRTKEIINRTGIFVSPIEAGYLTDTVDPGEIFEFAFRPGVGVKAPDGWEWSEKYGDWISRK